jgi:hypothetical protein
MFNLGALALYLKNCYSYTRQSEFKVKSKVFKIVSINALKDHCTNGR